MRMLPLLFAVFTAVLLMQADMSYARGGGGRSFGSRGSRSYQSSPSGAQPLQRSTAPQSAPSQPYAAPNPGVNPSTSRPFLSGLAGGVVGAGLGHLLFGGGGGMGGYGGGYGGGGGGGIFPLILIGLLVFFGYRYFRKRNASMFNMFGGNAGSQVMPMNGVANGYTPTPPANLGQDMNVSSSDIEAFKQLFLDVQRAWSEQNINKMRLCMTPEMVGYFNDELAANISRGVSNQVERISIRDVETVEAWQEDNLQFASMRMQWDACDYDVRLDRQPTDADYIASGSKERPETVQEQWTFSRAAQGRWLLSAIQQL